MKFSTTAAKVIKKKHLTVTPCEESIIENCNNSKLLDVGYIVPIHLQLKASASHPFIFIFSKFSFYYYHSKNLFSLKKNVSIRLKFM